MMTEALKMRIPENISIMNDLCNSFLTDLISGFLVLKITWDKTCIDLDPAFPEKPVTGQNK